MADEPDEAAAVGVVQARKLLASLAIGAQNSTTTVAAASLLAAGLAPADNGTAGSNFQGQQPREESTWAALLSALFYKLDNFDVNWPNLILALVLVMLMLTTAIGNLFVIVAILIERNLRTIGNYLVLSLAIADLLVACLVMPLAGIYQILGSWTLGTLLCDIWTSADVFCCTASILHLLAIALDRYWAVTRVDYIRCQRNERRILFMIFFVWMAACVISLAPVFGWKDDKFESRITDDHVCLLSQDIGYQIFATCTTFYFPLTLTLIFYWKIYQVARKRIRRKPGNRVKISLQHPSSSSSTSSPGFKLLQQQQQSNQSGTSANLSSEGQSSKGSRSIGASRWQRQRRRLYDLWPSGWLASRQKQQQQTTRASNAACCSPAESPDHLNSNAHLESQRLHHRQADSTNNTAQTLVGFDQVSASSSPSMAAGRPTNCRCLCHLPQQQAALPKCCLAQPSVGRPTVTATEQSERSATAVEFNSEACSGRPVGIEAAAGELAGAARDLMGVEAEKEKQAASSANSATMAPLRQATAASGAKSQGQREEQEQPGKCSLLGDRRQRRSSGDEPEKLRLRQPQNGDDDYHEMVDLEGRKSNADNQIFGARLSHSGTAGGSPRKPEQMEPGQPTQPNAQAQTQATAGGALTTGVGHEYNVGAGQSNATVQTKDSNQRNLAGDGAKSGEGSPAAVRSPIEASQLGQQRQQQTAACWPVGAHDFGSGCDNDRSPLQMDLASSGSTTAAEATAMAPSSSSNNDNNNDDDKTRPVYHDDHDVYDDDNDDYTNSNANVAAAEATVGSSGSPAAAGRSNGCSKCRRCHWARQARHRSATQIEGSELNSRQAAGAASSFSSEIQSSMASHSRASSLANCALDFNEQAALVQQQQQHQAVLNELFGCSRGQPLATNGCEQGSQQQQQWQRHQRAQQQQRHSSGAIGSPGNGSEFTETMLDECCGCCCNESHSGTAIAEADDNNDDIDMDMDMIGLASSSDRLSRNGAAGGVGGLEKRRLSSATSCSNSSGRLLQHRHLQQQHQRHRRQLQQRLAGSRVSLDACGLTTSELVAPPAAASDQEEEEQQVHQHQQQQQQSLRAEDQSPRAALIKLACEPHASSDNNSKLGVSHEQELSQQQQRTNRLSLVASLLALFQDAPAALCWRNLRAQLNRRSKNPFVPNESSAACEVGLLQAAACNVNNLNTILVDENGQSSLVRGTNGGATTTCKICQCVVTGNGGGGLQPQVGARQTASTFDKKLPPPPVPFPSTPPTLAGSGSHEQTRTRAAGMVIAASTANIAVTTVRPQFASSNSVQYQAATLAAAAATEGLESKRERKAAKTLAIITGVFVMCWLPFFVMALAMPLLSLTPHNYVSGLLLWLGYANSMLNPIIYTIFSPDFRKAFKRLLCGLDTEAERRRRRQGSPKQTHPTRSNTNNSYITDTQQTGFYNSCSSTTVIGASSSAARQSQSPFVCYIHPLLTRCCLPSVEMPMMSSTRTTMTTNITSSSNNKNINSETFSRKKTEQAITFDEEEENAGGLLANSN